MPRQICLNRCEEVCVWYLRSGHEYSMSNDPSGKECCGPYVMKRIVAADATLPHTAQSNPACLLGQSQGHSQDH